MNGVPLCRMGIQTHTESTLRGLCASWGFQVDRWCFGPAAACSRPPDRRTFLSGSVSQFGNGLGGSGGRLEVVHGVVAEVLEHPVLGVEQLQRRAVSGKDLTDVVLRNVQRVTLFDVVA